ncbi:COX15/CtaA family protein [Agromyces indicus]|uniref:COX15/CtaA family protein n=1 Tax=Agromyces indicus TaxID=758919 RepID=A0ABU1FKF6_9MICO|nr:COX15/CtaA family protein [Agromyces indicus]MDR5692234.1 COX15/CtaA family protein [Agromyces indicus]
MNRFIAWLPDRIDRRVRVAAWLSFLAQTIIIATGGAVRLTGSGLGCPTWPLCTEDSLVSTPEMGIHGVIEFGNRLMTGVVGIVALLVLLSIWRLRRERRDLWRLALVVVLGIVAQAVVGGITVWTGLNPFIVGFHYVASLLLVCVTAAYLVRLRTVPGPRVLAVPTWYARLAYASTVVLAVSIVFGVLTTASGPHSGDVDAGRTGYNAELLEHIHAWPGYALLVLTVALVIAARRRGLPVLGWSMVLLAVELVQIAVGLYQARNGLPPLLVGIHMVLAALMAATMTAFLLRMTEPAPAVAAATDAELAASAR